MLPILLVAAVINLSLPFSVSFSIPCINVSAQSSMMSGPLTPSLLDTCNLSMLSLGCKALCSVINFLIICSIPLCLFLKWFWVSYKEDCPGVYFLGKISAVELGFEKFSYSSKEIFSFFFILFFHFCLLNGFSFRYSQVVVIFLPSLYSDSFQIW